MQMIDMGAWFNDYSDLASDPLDPAPLNPTTPNYKGGALNEFGKPLNVYSGVNDQLLVLMITVRRFWTASIINSVLPVVLVFCLGMFIFCCGEHGVCASCQVCICCLPELLRTRQ